MWGEHGYMDRSGMFSYDDFVEFTKKNRKEHDLRGFDWYDFTDDGLEKRGLPHLKMDLSKEDLNWAIYPGDEDIFTVGVRGIYAQNYVYWDGNKNAEISKNLYGWKKYSKDFQRPSVKGLNTSVLRSEPPGHPSPHPLNR